MTRLLRLWPTFEDPVDRRMYFLSGLFLEVVKFAGDPLLVSRA